MIELKDILSIHRILIEEFGGMHGVRDEKGLDAAINRPYGIFNNQEFYPTPQEKSAAIAESLIINHPFIDGNKRIGYVMMRLFLLNSGKDIRASEEEKYEFVIEIAAGEKRYDEILVWINERLIDVKE